MVQDRLWCGQVGLYAEFAPAQLMSFLVSSQSYALGEAYELCAAAGLVREQVRARHACGNDALQLAWLSCRAHVQPSACLSLSSVSGMSAQLSA